MQVPTVCIERVYVWCNTSVIADEVLAHRLGLVPLNVDPAFLDFKDREDSTYSARAFSLTCPTAQNDQATDRNTLVFRLKTTCERRKNAPKDATDPEVLYTNAEVLSSQLAWVPQGEQEIVMAANPPCPTNPNIVLAKLRPGQEIDIELHGIKGVGKDHAKFSPVGESSCPLVPLEALIITPSHCIVPSTSRHHSQPVKTRPTRPRRKVSKMFFTRCHPCTPTN